MERIDPVARFWQNIERVDSGCWLWIGYVNKRTGYGQFSPDPTRLMVAHRFMYETLVEPIPEGLVLDHVCHSIDLSCVGGACVHRRCVNPSHLEPVTHRENVRRGRVSNRSHCPNGHPVTKDSHMTPPSGGRHCKQCHADLENERRRRQGISQKIFFTKEMTHCPKGHEMTFENTYIVPKTGNIRCKECVRIYDAKRYALHKQQTAEA